MYNIYHLLTAKKSIQTVQDSNLFGLTRYYGIYKSLPREEYNQFVNDLAKEQLIKNDENQHLFITSHGENMLIELHGKLAPYFAFDGMRFYEVSYPFSKHLILFIQIITHIHVKKTNFIPIIEDRSIQQFVKKVWSVHKNNSTTLLTLIYRDLDKVLQFFPDVYSALFVDQLTTSKQIGLSKYQLSTKYNINPHDCYLFFMNTIHYICFKIEDGEAFQFLANLYPNQAKYRILSDSARKTLYYLNEGFVLEKIAAKRHLKENTIKDHIVEIAYINKTLEWKRYITKQEYDIITEKINTLSTKKLKDIKEQLPESISYFQIKLVMALEQNGETAYD